LRRQERVALRKDLLSNAPVPPVMGLAFALPTTSMRGSAVVQKRLVSSLFAPPGSVFNLLTSVKIGSIAPPIDVEKFNVPMRLYPIVKFSFG